MADTKISALPASTTPLAGTEVLPIVQGGVTRQVSVANLTAGRAISATELTLSTGNLVIGTAGKGIDFSADPHAAGMTSELLDDYEEGTFTPVLSSSGTPPTITSYLTQQGFYTKIGNRVFATINIRVAMASAGTGYPIITGLPYSANGNCQNGPTFGLAFLISVQGTYGSFVSGTTIQFLTSGYQIAQDYCCLSIVYDV
jgi:hypothetical protein